MIGLTRASAPCARRRAPRRGVRIAALAVAMLAAADAPRAHLRPPGQSLIELLGRSDAVVLAEALGGTRDDRDAGGRLVRAATAFRLRRTIAGRGPAGDALLLEAAPPPLRYAGGQVAIVLVARGEGGGWRAVQGTGAGLVVSAALPDGVARALAELWDAVRERADAAALAGPLVRLIDAEPRKLAMMAALDLADLAHEGRLPASAERSLRERLAGGALAPEVRALLEHGLAPDARLRR